MKVLYAIQGTGNGHIARAREIVPKLQKLCQLELLVSGIQSDVSLPHEVKYKYRGASFVFGKKGGIDIWNTYAKNKVRRILSEYNDFPIESYDLVINDFEPISAWKAKAKGIPCVSLSHQCAVLAPEAPKPKKIDLLGLGILKSYAPTDAQYGFHFERYADNIHTPVIRSEIRQLQAENAGHYTVYLPAYSDEKLIRNLQAFPEFRWEVFSKHNRKAGHIGNVYIQPVNNERFIESLRSCEGTICGAGFEAPAEALFLGKKVLVIPMKGQYEQHCNAAAAKRLGVEVIHELSPKYHSTIQNWLENSKPIHVDYPDEVEEILTKVLSDFEKGLFG